MDDDDITYSSRHFEQLLQCSICLDRFKSPKLLPCQHTYCQSPCLEQLVNPRTRMIKCPECRADHLVPRGGTGGFPNNITIMGFMDLPRLSLIGEPTAPVQRDEGPARISDKEAPSWKSSGKSPPDVYSSGGGGVNYSYGEDTGANSSNVHVAPIPRKTTCNSCFRTSRLTLCHHCQQQICDMCCRQHMEQIKVEVERMLYRIKRGLPKISSAIDDISVKGNQSQQRCQTVKNEIVNLFERQVRDFQARQRFLMEEVDAFLIAELDTLRVQQENFEVEMASMASFCDSSETAISQDNIISGSELMQLHEQCQTNTDTMQNFESSHIRRVVPRRIELKSENQPLIDAIAGFGDIEIIGRPTTSSIMSGRVDHRSYESRLASRLVEISRPESSRYQSYRPSSRNIDTDYALSIIGSHSPLTSSPAMERRRIAPSYLGREPPQQTDDTDTYDDRNSRNPRSAVARVPRRRPRHEHHSDTRIAGLLGGEDSLYSRYRRRSLGGLSPQRENDDKEDDEPPVDYSRDRTFTRDRPVVSRQPERYHVPAENSSSSPEEERPVNSINQRPIRSNTSSNQSQAVSQSQTSNHISRGGRSQNQAEPRIKYNQKERAIIRFGSRGNGQHEFTWPRGVAVSPLEDTIFVADSSNHRVQVFDSTGQYLSTFGSYGTEDGEFDCLAGITVNNLGQVIIADRYNHRIQIFDHNFSFLTAFGEEGSLPGQMCYPWGIACDNMGFIYVCDKENSRIQVFQSNGAFVRTFGELGSEPGQLDNPQYLAVSPQNKIYVSDSSNHRIQVFSMYGDFLFTFGDSGAMNGEVKYPRGIAIDSQGFVSIADSGNNRVQIFRPDGTYYSMFGSWGNENGQFKALEGLAILANGNMVVSDRENHRIQIF